MVDVLGELFAHHLADFIIALANKVIGSGKAPKIGHGFEVPNDNMGRHDRRLKFNGNDAMISSCQCKGNGNSDPYVRF
jgi:hypothetical protein